MFTRLPNRLKRTSQWLPMLLLPFAAQAQYNYAPGNATNVAGTYTDLAATGTAIATANTDDANSTAQPIGFTFTYNGTAFTDFVLNTNGFIKLGTTAPSAADLFMPEAQGATQRDPIFSTAAANVNIIAPFNFDLTAGTAAGGTEYRVATTGTAPNRVCTIQWKNVSDKTLLYDQQYGSMSFQAKLYETSNTIEFVYGPTTQGTLPDDYRFAVVGIKGNSATSGNTVLSERTASSQPWSTNAFITGYYTNATHNYRGTVPPDAGRTYRFVTGAGCSNPTAATVSASNTAIQLSFTPGVSNASYIVTYTAAGGSTQTVTPAPTASPVTITGLTPATEYAITLQSVCPNGGKGTVIRGLIATTPVNDNPSEAVTLPVAATCTPVTSSNVGATTSPATGYANPGCGEALDPSDVWFKFTTAASGIGSTFVNIQTTGTAAGQIRVFSAASSAGPFTAVACGAGPGPDTSAGTLSVSSLTPGTTYYVFVSGYDSDDEQGPFTICVTGGATLADPTYATLPYTEGFEGPWATATSLRDVPTLSWRNNPTTGNSSWRRDDDGFTSANWSFEDAEADATPPYPEKFSAGAHSARFHSYGTADGVQGNLDLYVNLSGAGSKVLTFDYVNPTGSDKVDILVSTDGGATFGAAPLITLSTSGAFANYSVPIPGNSATTVIRFQATSDYGDDDLGIDNLQLRAVNATATRNETLAAAITVAPNPAHQRFTLAVPAGSLRTASATLRNALGQTVHTRQLSLPATGGTADFDVSRFAAGVYTLTLQSGSDLVVKRVVVE